MVNEISPNDDLIFPDTRLRGMGSPGLAKRDLFAAMAMQSFITRTDRSLSDCSGNAVECADALIAALEKK